MTISKIKSVHHVSEHLSTMCPVYTIRCASGARGKNAGNDKFPALGRVSTARAHYQGGWARNTMGAEYAPLYIVVAVFFKRRCQVEYDS